MSNSHGFTEAAILSVFPQVLQEDEGMYALAETAVRFLAGQIQNLDLVNLYANIDAMPEELLDILAYDFKVDWWDGDYTLTEKRQTLKDSWCVHRMLGTKGAVEMAIRALYPAADVLEWFEYGGKPYFFKLLIDLTGLQLNLERHQRILERAKYYKNLRSILEEIRFTVRSVPISLHIGGHMAIVTRIPLRRRDDKFAFQRNRYMGGAASGLANIPIPKAEDDSTMVTEIHTGGQVTILDRLPVSASTATPAPVRKLSGGGLGGIRVTIPFREIHE